MEKHYIPDFNEGMPETKADVQKILKNKNESTFKNTILAFDNAGKLLTRVSLVFLSQTEANNYDSLFYLFFCFTAYTFSRMEVQSRR